MSELFNGTYKKLYKDPIGISSQEKMYLCENITDYKKVTVKISSNSEYHENEFEIMKMCNNQFIVKLLDSFAVHTVIGTFHAIVTNYYENGDLARLIREKRNHDAQQIYKWSCEMIEAICYLHSNRIIHRNIKPSNLFITDENRIKLSGFGVSICLKDASTDFIPTYAGTPKYMSPEIINQREYSYNTDVWSTGCVIYELITFIAYFETKTLQNLENTSKELNELLKIMLVENPTKRINSDELIEKILKEQPKPEPHSNVIGHDDEVWSVTVLKNQSIASGNSKGKIKVWNSVSGLLLNTIEAHRGCVFSVAPIDNERLASGSQDKTIIIWNIFTGQLILTLKGHTDAVRCLAVLRGDRLASGSNDTTVIVWDVNTGQQLNKLSGHIAGVLSLAELEGDNLLASSSRDRRIKIWDLNSSNEIRIMKGHTDGVRCLLALPMNTLASASYDSTIRVWDIPTGTLILKLVGHTHYVLALCLLKDGITMASASADKTIRLWDIATGEAVAVLRGNVNRISSLALLEDGRLVSGSDHGMLVEMPAKRINEHTSANYPIIPLEDIENTSAPFNASPNFHIHVDSAPLVKSTAYSIPSTKATSTLNLNLAHLHSSPIPDTYAASSVPRRSTSMLNLVHVEATKIFPIVTVPIVTNPIITAKSLDYLTPVLDDATEIIDKILIGHNEFVCSVTVMKDDSIVSGDDKGEIKVWDSTEGHLIRTLNEHTDRVISLVVMEDGRLISGSFDNTIIIWDVTITKKSINSSNGEQMHSVQTLDFALHYVAALKDYKIALGSNDKRIIIWDVNAGQQLMRLRGQTDWIRTLVALEDDRLASGSDDRTIKLWNLSNGDEIRILKGHTDWIRCLLELPDERLASGSDDKTIRIWDTQNGQLIHLLLGHDGPVFSLCLLKDGFTMASASADKNIHLWEITTGILKFTLKGHTEWVLTLAILENGQLISGSADKSIIIWKPSM